ncbi:MAG: iron transporter FeoB [Firmicutes bacterium]|nr:iron transporter FeoB [Bacillota bacterium]
MCFIFPTVGPKMNHRDSVPRHTAADYTICLAGNPNTGKSTVFNALTGLKQHTGNWPGTTVSQTRGLYQYAGKNLALIDLPGTYSMLPNSPEEKIARDFICFGRPDVVVVVVDAACLERNLNLVLQVLEITPKVVVCLNLIDEAKRRGFSIDVRRLASELKVPVVPTAANRGSGLDCLKKHIWNSASKKIEAWPNLVQYPEVLECSLQQLEVELTRISLNGLSKRWVALRLLEDDKAALTLIKHYSTLSTGRWVCNEG